MDDGWVRDRKREFEELIDANRDGIVTAAELEVGVGPAALGSGVGLAGRWGGKAVRRWTRFLPRSVFTGVACRCCVGLVFPHCCMSHFILAGAL